MCEHCGEIEELWEYVDLMLLLRHRQIASLYMKATVAMACNMSHWTVIEPLQKKEILLLKIRKDHISKILSHVLTVLSQYAAVAN